MKNEFEIMSKLNLNELKSLFLSDSKNSLLPHYKSYFIESQNENYLELRPNKFGNRTYIKIYFEGLENGTRIRVHFDNQKMRLIAPVLILSFTLPVMIVLIIDVVKKPTFGNIFSILFLAIIFIAMGIVFNNSFKPDNDRLFNEIQRKIDPAPLDL